jgi:4-azaleucine resistance transporter AzlC
MALSFGVVATDSGFPVDATIAMSVIAYAAAAQFAAVALLAAGGGLAAAALAAALINARYLPMGFALGPSLKGSRLRRAVEGQAAVDSSWTMAARGDGSFDRTYLFGHSGIQYVAWSVGTAVGAFLPALDTRALGLDAVFPAFFVALLLSEVRDRRRLTVALLAAAVTLALVPVTPAGIPVLVASVAALVGLRRTRRAA